MGPSTLMLFTVNTVSSEEAMLCGRKINPAIIKIKVIFFKLCFVFNSNNTYFINEIKLGKMDILTTRNILDDMGHIFRIF